MEKQNIDSLCDGFSTKSINDLSSTEEYERLSYSKNLGIRTLIDTDWLRKNPSRYRRYLEYTTISTSEIEDVEMIRVLIWDFLSFKNFDSSTYLELATQAAKCKVIDMLILKYVEDDGYIEDDDDDIREDDGDW